MHPEYNLSLRSLSVFSVALCLVACLRGLPCPRILVPSFRSGRLGPRAAHRPRTSSLRQAPAHVVWPSEPASPPVGKKNLIKTKAPAEQALHPAALWKNRELQHGNTNTHSINARCAGLTEVSGHRVALFHFMGFSKRLQLCKVFKKKKKNPPAGLGVALRWAEPQVTPRPRLARLAQLSRPHR